MRKGIKYTLFLIVALASTTIPQINGDINVNPSQWNNLSVVPVKPIPLAQESSEPLNELWTPRIASVQKIWQLMISLSHPLSSKPFKTIPKETDSKTALYDKINRLSWKNWEMTRFIPANRP